MTAARAIDNAGTQNNKLEAIAPLVFPEQLFLAQLLERIMITPFWMGFENSLLVYLRPAAEAGDSIYTE
jgi:hypothetical protein